jgi:hypothetical protein
MTVWTKYVPPNYVLRHTTLFTVSYLAHLLDSYLSSSTIAGEAFNLGMFNFVAATLLYLSLMIPYCVLAMTGNKIFKDILLISLAIGIIIAIPQLSDLSPSPIGVSFFNIINRFAAYIAIFDVVIYALIFYKIAILDNLDLA